MGKPTGFLEFQRISESYEKAERASSTTASSFRI
jgi:hypothetical protein